MNPPLDAYRRHQQRLDRRLGDLNALDRRFSWYRLSALLAGMVLTLLVFQFARPPLGWGAVVLSLAAFAWVVNRHNRLDRLRLRFEIARRLTAEQIARLQLDWVALPPPLDGALASGSSFDTHPFAADLDLVGERSLQRLIDTCLSAGGSLRLRRWLLAEVPDPQILQERQALVGEMLPRRGFRSRLALNSALVARASAGRFQGERLVEWLEQEPLDGSLRRLLFLLSLLPLLTAALFLAAQLIPMPPLWLASWVVYLSLYMFNYRRFGEIFDQAYHLNREFERLRAALLYLEKYPYPPGSRMAALASPFCTPSGCPSSYLRTIAWVLSASSLKGNPFIWAALNALLPWDLIFASLLEGARRGLRQVLPTWLDAWYEFEALNSLANFAFLNPDYTFPRLRSQDAPQGAPLFAARHLGHPLIPASQRVCNDFSVDSLGSITLVTGSNMSGKSTFLRTLGVNLCLAFAGAPVCAASLETIPFRLFTCISLSDSLSDGISYFYAEVRRLKALLEELQRPHAFPLFYLIDEIFRGTNNRERQIGSRAYVRALASASGVGVISTHDLELVSLAEEYASLRNFHFREEVQAGRMVFDYRLRPGPCPTTNALKIMAREGLPVGED